MSVRKSVFWAFAGQIISFTTTLGTSIIVARLLSPHEMGIYAVAFATVGVLQIMTAFDIASYIVREKHLDARTLDTAFTVNAVLLAGLAVITYGLSFAGAAFYGEPAVADALQLLALGPLLSIFEFRPAAMLQRDMQFKWISIVTAARTLIGSLVTVATAFAGFSYMSLAFGYLAYGATGLLISNIVAGQHASLRLSMQNWRTIGLFGFRMMSISGLANLVVRLSDIILGRMLGLAALGLYSRAGGISSLIFQNIYGTATRVVFVQLARDYRETGVLRDTFLRGLQMITAVMWPILIGLAILSRPVILILFGEQWIPAATPLSLLLIAQFLTLCFGMNWELFVLRDETARQTRYEAIRACVSLALFVVGCSISLSAAAASRIAEALVGLLLYLPHMNRMAGTSSADLIRTYAQSALLTAVATAPALLLMMSSGWSAATPIPMMAASVATGILLWLATVALLKHPLFDELAHVGRRVRGLRQA